MWFKFDEFVNLNLLACHCTIHGVTDGTYNEVHPHIDVIDHILFQCHKM